MRHEGTINKMAGGCAPWNRFGARWRRISRGKEALAHEIWRGENLLPLTTTFLSLSSLSILHIIKNSRRLYMKSLMRLLMCTNVLALISLKLKNASLGSLGRIHAASGD